MTSSSFCLLMVRYINHALPAASRSRKKQNTLLTPALHSQTFRSTMDISLVSLLPVLGLVLASCATSNNATRNEVYHEMTALYSKAANLCRQNQCQNQNEEMKSYVNWIHEYMNVQAQLNDLMVHLHNMPTQQYRLVKRQDGDDAAAFEALLQALNEQQQQDQTANLLQQAAQQFWTPRPADKGDIST